MTSPRHASVPQTSPSHSLSSASSHRGSSPTSPHRSRSPSRSLDSSPMSSPLYGSSSSINSPKHTLHTYTSPPSSPSRSVSPSGSQKRKTSPLPSPKHLSSTPNSPQHTVTKTSPKSFFRQCTLWVQSARKSSENNASKENAAHKETVDSNSNPKQSKTTEMKPEVLANGSVKQVSPQHTQDVSLSDPLSTDISLPQQYSDYSPYTQPAIMKSYVHIYRQSSLPEEESEESLRLSVSPFSSPQHQRYKWITRHTVPPPTIPCPYNELFKQASLQESRYKPNKTPYQQTSISVPQLNKNIHTSSSQGNSEEYHKRECTRVSSLNSTCSVSDMPEKHVPRQSSLPERSTLTVTGQYQPHCVTRNDIKNSPISSVTQKITVSPETIHEQIHITLCSEPDALESPQRNVSSCRYEVPILSASEDDHSKSLKHGCSLKNDGKLDSRSIKEGKDSHALPQGSKSRNEPPRKEKGNIFDHSGKGNKSCNLTRPDSSPDIPSVQSNKICSPSPQGKKHSPSPSPDKKPGTPPLQERRSTTTNKRDSKPGTPPLQDGKSTLPRSRDRKSSSSSTRDSKPGTPPLQERKCTSSLQDSKPVTPPLRDRKSSTSLSRDRKSSTSSSQDSKSARDRKASITSLHEGKPVTPPLRERKSSSSSQREGKATTPSSQDKKSSSSLRDKPSTSSQQDKKTTSKDKKSQDKKPGTPPLKTRKSSSSMVEDKKGNIPAECKNTGYTSKEDKKSDSTLTKDKTLPNKALSTTTTRPKKPSSSRSQENVSDTPSTKDKTSDSSIKHSKKADISQIDSKKAAGSHSQLSHTTTPVTSPVHGKKNAATSHDKKSSTSQSKNEEVSPSIYGKEASKTDPKASHSTHKTSTLTRQKSKSNTLIDQEGRPVTLPRKDTKSGQSAVHIQQNSGNKKCKTSMQDVKPITSPKDKNTTVNPTKQDNKPKTTKRQDSRSDVHKIPTSKSCTFKRQNSKPDSSKGESSKPCTIARQNSKSGNLSSSDSKPDILSKENDEYIMPASNNKAHKSQPPQAYCSKMEEPTKASNPDHSCAISCLLPRTSSQNSLHNLSTCQHTGLGLNDAHSHEPFITPVHQQSQHSKISAQNKHPSASEHELEPLLPAEQQPPLSTQQNALPSLTEPNPMSAPIQEQPKSVNSPVPIPNSGPLKLQAQVLLIQSQPSCSPCLSSLSSGGPSRQPVTKTYLVDKPMSHHHHHPKLLFSSPIGDALSPCTPNS